MYSRRDLLRNADIMISDVYLVENYKTRASRRDLMSLVWVWEPGAGGGA
jgi:hypothetical protein